jgi:hypothetical protein
MWLMREWRLSTWTLAGVLHFVKRLPSAGSLACDQCGRVIAAHVEDGTLSSTCVISFSPPSVSHSSVVLALTHDGKLSILCGCSRSAAHRSPDATG